MREQDTLSIHRSFIVRLYPGIDLDAGKISGSVEHIVSGEAAEFHSVEDFLRVIGLLLNIEENDSEK